MEFSYKDISVGTLVGNFTERRMNGFGAGQKLME